MIARASGVTIRPGTAADAPVVLALIRALAAYERLASEVVVTEDQVREHLFGAWPAAEVLIAWVDGAAAGFALYFQNYSTFLGRPGIYLEDLFVEPTFRGQGIGKQLFAAVAKIAVERGCGRYEWAVLDWNAPAIDFYKSFGARPMQEWTVFRLAGDDLARLAALTPGAVTTTVPAARPSPGAKRPSRPRSAPSGRSRRKK